MGGDSIFATLKPLLTLKRSSLKRVISLMKIVTQRLIEVSPFCGGCIEGAFSSSKLFRVIDPMILNDRSIIL